MKRIVSGIISLMMVVVIAFPVSAKTDFSDVKDPSWYSNSVSYVVNKGYMSGVGNNQFAPQGNVSRAQVVQILYAKEGKPSVADKEVYKDVPNNRWYSSAVSWCSGKEIVSGYPDHTFKPDQYVTREQLVAILYKYLIYLGKEPVEGTIKKLSDFSDANDIATYAVPAMKWAVGNGIISGNNNRIEPKGTANRAQIAVIIKAFCEKVESDENNEIIEPNRDANDDYANDEKADGSNQNRQEPDNSNGDERQYDYDMWELPFDS